MVELVYLHDGYKKELETTVTSVSEHEGSILVELEETIFYPTGGGQPHDEGIIVKDLASYTVTAVYKLKDKVFHIVDRIGLQKGDKVICKIDWTRRHRFMRMHTAAHIISDLLEADANTLVSGNQLGLEKSRIDFTLDNFDRDYLQTFEKKANEIVHRALPVKKYFVSREAAQKDKGLFTLLKGFPEHIQKVRVVDIDGFDKTACGGTHVDNTSEIKGIKFLKFENKGAKRRRIVFTLVDH